MIYFINLIIVIPKLIKKQCVTASFCNTWKSLQNYLLLLLSIEAIIIIVFLNVKYNI